MNNIDDITREMLASEDDKYGGLNPSNLKEGLDYFQIEEIIEHRSKIDDDLDSKIESDYHNTYYLGDGKYGLREIKLKK